MAATLPSSRHPSHQSAYLSPNPNLPSTNDEQPAQPRRSTDTEHRHLLSDDRSIAPSDSASAYLSPTNGDETPGERTPRARSPAQGYREHLPPSSSSAPRRMTIGGDPDTASIMTDTTTTTTASSSRPYRGFPSEEAYLDALRAWAEDRMYLQSGGHSLIGYYGNKTMEEYAKDRPPELQGLGLRRKWKARRERKAGERERAKSLA